ncbi:hypothetical protein HID58_043571 [Brassica napus]|uniref:Zinc knuckle CX2CX4HX4C domain-containing protein n=1 Tax=Brassica napus TaxID=3708 RepID=A0ABQ8BHA1_BRANA|nr:hypothetical protein HID58_043571 [Brassica napus]
MCFMCGEWVCDNGGKWEFVLDKRQMARLVPLYEGMSLRELQGNVLRDFGVEEGPRDARKEAPEKTPNARVVNLEEVEFVREVERVEEVINRGSAFRQEKVLGGSNVGEDAVDERDVRPRGYDKEFWSPLLKDTSGVTKKTKLVPNKCGRCRMEGHNRSSCTNPI